MTEVTKVETDECGRISLPREVRERYGDEYRLVELRSSIKLVPVPEDPLEALQSAASEELKSASVEDVKAIPMEEVQEGVDAETDDE